MSITFSVICRSFDQKPVNEAAVGPVGKELFEKEQDDLLQDLIDIPKKACDRRVWLNPTLYKQEQLYLLPANDYLHYES